MSRGLSSFSALLVGLGVSASLLFADGGTVQFQKQAGPFLVTLFSAPVPLRVGVADLSVLVQRTDDRSEVLDCEVRLTLSKPGERDVLAVATRAQATNKLLYAARAALPSAGKWNGDVEIKAHGGSYHAAGEVDVLTREPRVLTYWPYFAVLPMAITLFILNQLLKRRRRKLIYPRARP